MHAARGIARTPEQKWLHWRQTAYNANGILLGDLLTVLDKRNAVQWMVCSGALTSVTGLELKMLTVGR
jgi:hypothetical protein